MKISKQTPYFTFFCFCTIPRTKRTIAKKRKPSIFKRCLTPIDTYSISSSSSASSHIPPKPEIFQVPPPKDQVSCSIPQIKHIPLHVVEMKKENTPETASWEQILANVDQNIFEEHESEISMVRSDDSRSSGASNSPDPISITNEDITSESTYISIFSNTTKEERETPKAISEPCVDGKKTKNSLGHSFPEFVLRGYKRVTKSLFSTEPAKTKQTCQATSEEASNEIQTPSHESSDIYNSHHPLQSKSYSDAEDSESLHEGEGNNFQRFSSKSSSSGSQCAKSEMLEYISCAPKPMTVYYNDEGVCNDEEVEEYLSVKPESHSSDSDESVFDKNVCGKVIKTYLITLDPSTHDSGCTADDENDQENLEKSKDVKHKRTTLHKRSLSFPLSVSEFEKAFNVNVSKYPESCLREAVSVKSHKEYLGSQRIQCGINQDWWIISSKYSDEDSVTFYEGSSSDVEDSEDGEMQDFYSSLSSSSSSSLCEVSSEEDSSSTSARTCEEIKVVEDNHNIEVQPLKKSLSCPALYCTPKAQIPLRKSVSLDSYMENVVIKADLQEKLSLISSSSSSSSTIGKEETLASNIIEFRPLKRSESCPAIHESIPKAQIPLRGSVSLDSYMENVVIRSDLFESLYLISSSSSSISAKEETFEMKEDVSNHKTGFRLLKKSFSCPSIHDGMIKAKNLLRRSASLNSLADQIATDDFEDNWSLVSSSSSSSSSYTQSYWSIKESSSEVISDDESSAPREEIVEPSEETSTSLNNEECMPSSEANIDNSCSTSSALASTVFKDVESDDDDIFVNGVVKTKLVKVFPSSVSHEDKDNINNDLVGGDVSSDEELEEHGKITRAKLVIDELSPTMNATIVFEKCKKDDEGMVTNCKARKASTIDILVGKQMIPLRIDIETSVAIAATAGHSIQVVPTSQDGKGFNFYVDPTPISSNENA